MSLTRSVDGTTGALHGAAPASAIGSRSHVLPGLWRGQRRRREVLRGLRRPARGAGVAVAPVAVAPTTADTAATVVRPPLVDDASLMPRSRGGGRVVAVVAIDLALVIGGLVLWTRSPTTAPASPRTGGAGAVATSDGDARGVDGAAGSGALPGGGAASGSGRPAGGSSGGGSSGGGGGGGGRRRRQWRRRRRAWHRFGRRPRRGRRPLARRPPDRRWPRPGSHRGRRRPRAGRPRRLGRGRAAGADAAGAAPELADAATADLADADDGEVSAQVVEQQFNRLAVASESKLGRCYQTATKALPDDQPIVGEVDIALAVMPTGKTENVRVEANTTGSQTLANCALGVVQAWSFSPHTAAGPLVFSRKFRFGPGQ
jgi:TonB family protein